MQTIRTSLLQRNVSYKAAEIIMHSWAKASLKQYKPYLQTWIKLWSKWKINPYYPPLIRVLGFITSLFERGLKYEPKHGFTLGSQSLISRSMKGMFRSRPPAPRYEAIWDVRVVLSHLASFTPLNQLDLKSLTRKLVMSVALVLAKRMQSIHLLDLQLMKTGTDMVEFAFPTKIKQSRPVTKTYHFSWKLIQADPGLCFVINLREYITRT